jgi:uncharacterized phage protein (TIGR01671 family)
MFTDADNEVKIYLNGAVSIQDVWSTQHIELMQFTGLLDKNGKEIYEGDIVSLKGKRKGTKPVIGTVEYTPEEAQYHVIVDILHFPLNYYEQEVIGNIYSNPELLNQTS